MCLPLWSQLHYHSTRCRLFRSFWTRHYDAPPQIPIKPLAKTVVERRLSWFWDRETWHTRPFFKHWCLATGLWQHLLSSIPSDSHCLKQTGLSFHMLCIYMCYIMLWRLPLFCSSLFLWVFRLSYIIYACIPFCRLICFGIGVAE